jgi:hypothetical protein
MTQLPTKTATQTATEKTAEPASIVERQKTKTIEISTIKIEFPITTNRPEFHESQQINIRLSKKQTSTLFGILYGLQLSGEKMDDGSVPKIHVDALKWMLEKIGKQFEIENEI